MTTEYFYTAKQLAGLPGMPGTEQAVNRTAKRENWPYRQREGRGGGREYAESGLPAATRAHLRGQRDIATVKTTVADVISKHGIVLPEYDIRDWQRVQRDARDGVIKALKTLMDEGLSLERAYTKLEMTALEGGPSCHEFKMLEMSRDGRGQKTADGLPKFPSVRSVQRWFAADDLTPKARKKDMHLPAWADDFLDAYRQPQKPSVEQAYTEFCRHYPGDRPSIHQVRRFLDKLPAIVREKGRMGPRELKNIKPFVRRTFEELWPNDVWSADGHTFDAEVQNPLSGKPFRPEITSIIDIGTRKIVGFSVSLAESALSTVDALRYAMTQHGVPAIFYVDNGSGYSNEMLKNEAVGLLARFGITVKHSLPYNSQARGVIERLHKSVWVAAAKTLPSYIGADMDKQASDLNHKLTRTGDKNGVVHMALSWTLFIQLCEDAIDAYNRRPHSGLPKFSDEDNRRRHYSPAEYWRHRAETLDGYTVETIADDVADMLFKPRITRTVNRGEVQLFNNKYFSQALAGLHGEEVQVAYDIHDADFVWIYGLEGEFICKAEWGGNEKAYFPKPVVELAREQRADAQIKLLEGKIEDRLQERSGGNLLEAIPANELPGMEIIAKKIEVAEKQPVDMAATIPQEDRERYWFWRSWCEKAANGTAIPEGLQLFMQSYPTSAKCRAMDAFFNPDNQQEAR